MTDEKRPSLAEKVRFWEEQDKINQALIPRVLEIHDAVRSLHERTANTSGQIAAGDARLYDRVHGEVVGVARDIEERTVGIRGEIAAAEARIYERVHGEVVDAARDSEKRAAEMRAEIAEAARIYESVQREIVDETRELKKRTAEIHGEIATAETRVCERVREKLIGSVRLIALAALALSAVAFALSLYQVFK